MLNDRVRILELALESLENKKRQIEEEIAGITRELRAKSAVKSPVSKSEGVSAKSGGERKRFRFSKEERLRRSQRMKEYWENWRKKKSRAK